MRRLLAMTATAAAVAALAPATAGAARTQDLQVLAINDFHGNLEPPTGSSGRVTVGQGQVVDAGGAAYLSTHLKQLRKGHRHTITASAGDLVGASPLLSGLFHDEP